MRACRGRHLLRGVAKSVLGGHSDGAPYVGRTRVGRALCCLRAGARGSAWPLASGIRMAHAVVALKKSAYVCAFDEHRRPLIGGRALAGGGGGILGRGDVVSRAVGHLPSDASS